MDFTKTVTHVSLCAGYGGIDLGLKRAIPSLRTVAFSEIEAFAVANLVSKMEAGLLDPAPIWTDLKRFPYGDFHGLVDILSGGYPCQPFSSAGKRLGDQDPRHLWPFIRDGIKLMQPRVCFFENVEGHISLGLQQVISDLEGLGYRTTWGIFSAAEVGAPHQRKRVFILAVHVGLADEWRKGLEGHTGDGCGGYEPGWLSQAPNGSTGEGGVCGGVWEKVSFASECIDGEQCALCLGDYSDCPCPGPTQDGWDYQEFDGVLYERRIQLWPARPGEPQHPWEPSRVTSVGDAPKSRKCGEHGCHLGAGKEAHEERHSNHHITDGSSEDSVTVGNPHIPRREGCSRPGLCGAGRSQVVSPKGCERKTQPPLGGDPHGAPCGLDYAELCVSGDSRIDELRLLGNGVVPEVAYNAFTTLMKRFTTL